MLSIDALRQASKPLRLIFWGSLIWLIDLSVSDVHNGSGFKFDLLDDTVGTLMIAVGIFRLSRLPVSDNYALVMRILRWLAIIAVAQTAQAHFVFPQPIWYTWMLSVMAICQTVGFVLLCLAMKWLCEAGGFPALMWHWNALFWISLVAYLTPEVILVLAGASGGGSGHYTVDPSVLLALFAVSVAMLIYFLVTLERTRRATLRGVPNSAPGGFPVVLKSPEPPQFDKMHFR